MRLASTIKQGNAHVEVVPRRPSVVVVVVVVNCRLDLRELPPWLWEMQSRARSISKFWSIDQGSQCAHYLCIRFFAAGDAFFFLLSVGGEGDEMVR